MEQILTFCSNRGGLSYKSSIPFLIFCLVPTRSEPGPPTTLTPIPNHLNHAPKAKSSIPSHLSLGLDDIIYLKTTFPLINSLTRTQIARITYQYKIIRAM